MPCCRHPLAIVLHRKGYIKAAEKIDSLISDDENVDVRAKLDMIKSIILDQLNVSPVTADAVAEHILDIFDTGPVHHRKWPNAHKVLIRAVKDDHRVDDKDAAKQLAKLKPFWSRLTEAVLESPDE